jgi:hypothetical protein
MNNRKPYLLPILVALVALLGSTLACGKRTPQVITVIPQVITVAPQVITAAPVQQPANPPAATQAPAPAPTNAPAPTTPPNADLPVIDYFTSEASGQAGCYYLHWDLHNATAAYLNGQGITAPASTEVCPTETSVYVLHAENAAGQVEQEIVIEVGDNAPVTETLPTNLRAQVVGADLMITWTDGRGEAGYRLTLDGESVDRPADSTSYTWFGPPCGRGVQIGLMALRADGSQIGGLMNSANTPACAAANLVIVDPRFSQDPVTRGQPFQAIFVVENRGDGAAGPFTVFWQFHELTGLKNCCTLSFNGLAAHGQVSGIFRDLVTNINPGNAPTWIEVDHDGQVAESDENDNRVDLTLHIAQ